MCCPFLMAVKENTIKAGVIGIFKIMQCYYI